MTFSAHTDRYMLWSKGKRHKMEKPEAQLPQNCTTEVQYLIRYHFSNKLI